MLRFNGFMPIIVNVIVSEITEIYTIGLHLFYRPYLIFYHVNRHVHIKVKIYKQNVKLSVTCHSS